MLTKYPQGGEVKAHLCSQNTLKPEKGQMMIKVGEGLHLQCTFVIAIADSPIGSDHGCFL